MKSKFSGCSVNQILFEYCAKRTEILKSYRLTRKDPTERLIDLEQQAVIAIVEAVPATNYYIKEA